ncbi:hypothetical protein KR009_012135 [Drosophila setifemur]|nr:hypothetical protein KR009_012135 [Drosophila setifemur]
MVLASLLAAASAQSLDRAGRSALPAQPADHLVPPPLPIPQRLSHAGAGLASGSPVPVVSAPPSLPAAIPEPGFMSRVARWFGLGGQPPKDQQLSPSNSLSYAYPKPGQSFDASGKPCSLCNKNPWVPMVGHPQQLNNQLLPQQQAAHQQHLNQNQNQNQNQHQLQVQQQQLWHLQQPVAQASQQRQRAVQFHPNGQIPGFLPLAVPMPPLYNAQPFRPIRPNKENVVAQSEVQPVPVPTPAPPASTSSFEIVQSHQVTDFVTSVEYPATFVQSHAIDLGSSPTGSHKTTQEWAPGQGLPLDISTVRYQLDDLSSGQVHQHLPASQLLTELGHFAETTTLAPPADNYPAASSQQLQQEQEQEQEQEPALFYAEQFQEDETSTLDYSTTTEPPTTTHPAPPAQAPAIELNNHLAAVEQQRHHPQNYRQGIGRGRETPKRLLDSPINHASLAGGSGRPFTRDPADLNFRLSQVYTPTQPPTPTSTYGAIDASGQFAGMAPPSPQQVIIPYTTKQRPRPFESWTPIKQENHRDHNHNHHNHNHQSNDLEEEPHEQQESKLATATVTAPNSRRTTKYLTKILASNLRELLKRERETKRLPGSAFGVDISRLQHNIDGWTEQEYNSLSHRPSTPTIRGRSKHIPSEYLTTTTTTTPAPLTVRQSKTTRGEGFELGAAPPTDTGDLSTSINNLEQLHLLGERGSKRFQPLEDNRLHFDYYDARPRSTPAMTTLNPSTTTATSPPTPSTTTTEVAPLYVRSTLAPKELWNQVQVAILPQTNEKVYVVTPQPPSRHHQEHHEASASAPRPVYQTPAPRFPRMRPTPAGEVKAVTPTPSSSQVRNYTPDIFGLMGLSAYVPAEPVEIIDGNSKVLTVMTAAPTAAALQRPTAKPTMSPSPR